MIVPWYKKNPGRYSREKEEVESKYPELHVCKDDSFIIVRGTFPVVNDSGRIETRYDIEVRVPPAYPDELPVVYEVGGDIPRHLDRHISSEEGRCCLEAEVDFWMRHGSDYNLVDFLEGPVFSFFAAQRYFDITGEWPHGERSHGSEGIFQAYEEILNTRDRAAICRWVYMLKQDELNPHFDCPCGSGKPTEECHPDLLKRVRDRIPKSVFERSFMWFSRHPDFSLVW